MIIFPERPLLNGVALTILFSSIGILMMMIAYKLIDALTPGQLGKEIVENKNVAVAVFVGSMVIGVSLIIAAAVGG